MKRTIRGSDGRISRGTPPSSEVNTARTSTLTVVDSVAEIATLGFRKPSIYAALTARAPGPKPGGLARSEF